MAYGERPLVCGNAGQRPLSSVDGAPTGRAEPGTQHGCVPASTQHGAGSRYGTHTAQAATFHGLGRAGTALASTLALSGLLATG